MKRNHKVFYVFITTAVIVILDQFLKFIARKSLSSGIEITSFFRFRLATNTGAAFSLFEGYTSLLIWISLIVIGFILYYYDSIPKLRYVQLATGLLLGGTIGNLIDRIAYGHVVDFIDFSFWPTFNIADSALVVGILLLGWYSIKSEK